MLPCMCLYMRFCMNCLYKTPVYMMPTRGIRLNRLRNRYLNILRNHYCFRYYRSYPRVRPLRMLSILLVRLGPLQLGA